MNKLTIRYITEIGDSDDPHLILDLIYNEYKPRTCTYRYDKAWEGWEWVDGDSEPNMSREIRDLFDSKAMDSVFDIIQRTGKTVSIDIC